METVTFSPIKQDVGNYTSNGVLPVAQQQPPRDPAHGSGQHGQVFVSFSQPPCTLSNVPDNRPNDSAQPLQADNCVLVDNVAAAMNQPSDADAIEKVDHLSEEFINSLQINENTSCNGQNTRPPSMENGNAMLECSQAPPYSFLLPPGTFVQRFGGTVPPQMYQQFSPVLASTVPQFHTVYPVNIIPRDPSQCSSAYVPARNVIAQECSSQEPPGQPLHATAVYAPSVQEGTWSVHTSAMPNPPPIYWGHYMSGEEKPHGIPLAPQQFLRRHSVCDESVVTPTNVCPPCNIAGIVSATPEFIHPRKPDVPQWLMSPPVGEQDPSIISYAPMMYHNVRVPSITGIAIPVVGAVGAAPGAGTNLNNADPQKIDSPAVVLSPVPYYENALQPSNIEGTVNPEPGAAEVFADPSPQQKMQHLNAFDQGLAGPPLFRRVVELQQQPQCWQCVLNEKTPDVKHPTPDFCNQWPNIPPPPDHIVEDNNCGGEPDDAQLGSDVLPLAAALFQGEANDCCGDNGMGSQEDDIQLPQTYPIGVFWDIENCAVPSGKSALSVVKRVRERFFAGHKEAEFMCVCDINKESRHVIQDLNNAQVNVVHISATAKNAADDKLRQSIRRFAHNHPAPATLVLITGDSNFTAEVSDLRHRHKYFVVLIHPVNAGSALLQAATTTIAYDQLVGDLPVVHTSPKGSNETMQTQLLVSGLPRDNDANAIRNRLRQLSDNCGGKVVKLSSGTAILKFASTEAANRALKRLEGEDVFGHKITVALLQPSPSRPGFHHNKYPNTVQSFSPKQVQGTEQIEPVSEIQNHDMTAAASNIRQTIVGSHLAPRPIVNLTPGHCDMNVRPRFQPPYATVTPVSTPFPVMATNIHRPPCPVSAFSHNTPFQFPAHSYNSMPPPPQPQLFQPPVQYMREDNQQIGVKLTISNIDAQLGVGSIQDVILKHISAHCQVLDMKIRPHNRFTVVCDVTVPRVRDASRVLQHLQRQKIGNKRVLVTLTQQSGEESGSEDGISLRRECFSILRNCGDRGMPLYKFMNICEKRFQHKVKLAELRQIPDAVLLREGQNGKEIILHPNVRDEQAFEHHLASYPRSGRSTPDINHDFLLPVCKLHYPPDAPRPPSVERHGGLLKIEMGLREFSAKLHALLHSHNGILQLDGFEYCYRAEYGSFPTPSDIHEGGVIVEHQASYVPGVQIITSQPHCLGVKAIVWAQPQSDAGSDTASDTSGVSRWKSPNLIQFSREVVELLKDRPYCCLPYDDFNSAYHRCFGHPCRVSEYGFTRLSDLLTAIPHVLQIMGSLSNRILTLTHRAQVKRFTQEVIRILKATPDRAILVAQMPELYNRMFNKAWRLRDYGVSVLSDILDDIPEGHICTIGEGDNVVLSLPVRERTADEKERTNQFAREVVKILRSRPHYRMPFTDFVPTYHRQFGRQCKLANYGFTKLIDLFEALPHVVQVIEKGSEKILALTETEQQKILSMQITSILRAQQPSKMLPQVVEHMRKTNPEGPTLPLACIPALFQQKYGFSLIPSDVGASDIDDLAKKLSHAIKIVINKTGDKMVRLAERKPLRLLSAQLLALLLDQPSDQLDTEQLHSMYADRYKENIEPSEYGFLTFTDIIKKALPGVVKMDLDASESTIHLKPLYREARAIRSILLKNNGAMTLGEFNFAYLTTNGCPVNCETYGFQSVEALLRALPNVLIVKGYGIKKTIALRNHMQCGPLTGTSSADSAPERGLCGSASMDSLQSFESVNSRHPWIGNARVPTLPKWASKHMASCLVSSASMADFRSVERDSMEHGSFRQSRHAGWVPPPRPAVPPFPGYQFPYQRPSFRPPAPHPDLAAVKPSKISAQKQDSPACKFSPGGTPTSNFEKADTRTPMRRGISVSVITLPNGSTPIASTSSCSSASTPRSAKSSFTSEESSEYSSDEDQIRREKFGVLKRHAVSSLPNSPFAHAGGGIAAGGRHPHSENGSPGRLHMAASFPTLAQS